MKRTKLLKEIARAARSKGLVWELVRQGANHEIWRCDTTQVSIPRHKEINELTSEGIRKQLGNELGEGWWR